MWSAFQKRDGCKVGMFCCTEWSDPDPKVGPFEIFSFWHISMLRIEATWQLSGSLKLSVPLELQADQTTFRTGPK